MLGGGGDRETGLAGTARTGQCHQALATQQFIEHPQLGIAPNQGGDRSGEMSAAARHRSQRRKRLSQAIRARSDHRARQPRSVPLGGWPSRRAPPPSRRHRQCECLSVAPNRRAIRPALALMIELDLTAAASMAAPGSANVGEVTSRPQRRALHSAPPVQHSTDEFLVPGPTAATYSPPRRCNRAVDPSMSEKNNARISAAPTKAS